MIESNNVFAFVQDGKPTCTIVTGSANEDREMGELLQEKVKEITGINPKIANGKQASRSSLPGIGRVCLESISFY